MVNRKLAGAHYGLRDWAMQRITAVVMLIYTFIFFFFLLSMFGAQDYTEWQQFFAKTWVKVFTQTTFIAVFLHAWVGIRDLWMDYIKPFGLRLFLQSATIVWLIGCAIYSIKVIWG
ncbi:MAG: succinate dehydrogenase, hydrophobic membrane anchor protein [Neisseria sp.]|uniref:succinate dehydrogenase, hydrophobic membrane anchor protein n=1 Tax=Neisseria sp. TaxID=192066 RepID=UPI0026DB7216|nr:succinate dehydrogenase, hydrophobic membrane anchor protein [Neisseria sp.]MDO4640563.1 succinate dehydrogenase, hydrophobic membrane anchor protein [Neisseria sp.]